MDNQVVYLFLFFIFIITMAGGWIPTLKPWSQEAFRMLISFCAGVLLGAVFFHMVPEISPILGRKMGFPIMLGFLGIYVMEKFIMVHPCEEGACDYHKIGVAAYIGIGFHSILDGVAIGAGNMLNISMVILLAVTIHKFPAALALSSILVKGGEYSRKKILTSMFIFALATPIGALVSMNVMGHLDNTDIIGFARGISAGTFLYIYIGYLLPTVHEEDEKKNVNLVLLFVGILVMFLSTVLE